MIKQTLIFFVIFMSLVVSAKSLRVVHADDLYDAETFDNLISDARAMQIGDTLTVIVYQSTEARNSARKDRSKKSGFAAGVNATGTNEYADISLGSEYTGVGEIRRAESFITSLSVTVIDKEPNGLLWVDGRHSMRINGEISEFECVGKCELSMFQKTM